MEVEASAPASAANLGPGFDVLALALELRCRVTATRDERWSVRHVGPEFPRAHFDTVLAAAQEAVGEAKPLALVVDNYVPIGKGLGSSAAAAVAGAVAAWRAHGTEPEPEQVFDLVAKMEEHPDNAAAAVYGGLVLCPPDGKVRRLALHQSLFPLVAVPNESLATAEARGALVDHLPRGVAVRSLGRMGALVAGLIEGDDDLLAGAADDEMHEAPRSGLRPQVGECIAAARKAGASHVSWSGAGPAVLALVKAGREGAVREAMEATMQSCEVRRLEVAADGFR